MTPGDGLDKWLVLILLASAFFKSGFAEGAEPFVVIDDVLFTTVA